MAAMVGTRLRCKGLLAWLDLRGNIPTPSSTDWSETEWLSPHLTPSGCTCLEWGTLNPPRFSLSLSLHWAPSGQGADSPFIIIIIFKTATLKKKLVNLVMYGCAGSSLLCGLFFSLESGGCSLPVVRRLLTAAASSVAEHRL